MFKKVGLLAFATLTLILVLQNPLINSINIFYTTDNLSQDRPASDDGLRFQGSFIVSQTSITYINQTSSQVVGYKSTVSFLNLGSLFICFVPLSLYVLFRKPGQAKNVKPYTTKT